jgi:hypothetical protein
MEEVTHNDEGNVRALLRAVCTTFDRLLLFLVALLYLEPTLLTHPIYKIRKRLSIEGSDDRRATDNYIIAIRSNTNSHFLRRKIPPIHYFACTL